MKITGAKIIPLKMPIRHEGHLGIGRIEDIRNVILYLYSDQGLRGVGEASPWPVFGADQKSIVNHLQDILLPALMGKDPQDINSNMALMEQILYGASFARAAIDMALHDLVARSLQIPLYRLLGGMVRDRMPLGVSIFAQNIHQELKEMESLIDRGIRVFKVKTGVLSPAEDRERIGQMKKYFGAEIDLRLDYNQALEPERALKLVKEMEKSFNPTFIEQPVPREAVHHLAMIAREIDTPLMADESLFSIYDALSLVRHRAADIFSIKLMKTGGLLGAKKISSIGEAAGIPCYAGAMWESSAGIAASLHFSCSTVNVKYGSDYYIPYFLMKEDLVRDPLELEDGFILLPKDAPGLGVEIDPLMINKYSEGEIVI